MSWDQKWEEIHKGREWGKYPSEPLIRFISGNFLKCNSNKLVKVLELGCGTGANLWFVAREGLEVHGLDGSQAAIEKTRNRLDKEVPGWCGKVFVGDMIDLPYENDVFDAVIDIEAVTHNKFENSKSIYKEALRVLKPKGKMFSQTFSTGSWGDKTGERIEKNGWVSNEGPTSLGEFIRFTSNAEITIFMDGFCDVSVEKLTRSMNNQKNHIHEWLITGTKP